MIPLVLHAPNDASKPILIFHFLVQKLASDAQRAERQEVHHILCNAWDGNEDHMKDACTEVRTICKRQGYHVPVNLPHAIRKYWGRCQQFGSPVTFHHKAGAPKLIPDQQVEFCLTELLSWKSHGRLLPYPSIEVLAAERPAVQQVLDSTGITVQTLVRRMKEKRPTLKRVQLQPKKKLTAKHKGNRVRDCKELIKYTDADLQRVVYIDAKSMPMLISEVWGWVDTADADTMVEVERAQTRKAKSVMLNYYIAVCGLAGAVLLYFYTGSTGVGPTRDGITFMVSSALKMVGWSVGHNMLHRLLQHPALS